MARFTWSGPTDPFAGPPRALLTGQNLRIYAHLSSFLLFGPFGTPIGTPSAPLFPSCLPELRASGGPGQSQVRVSQTQPGQCLSGQPRGQLGSAGRHTRVVGTWLSVPDRVPWVHDPVVVSKPRPL